MEAEGVVLRIDSSVTPTMAKTPTLAQWELDLLRSVERVVRDFCDEWNRGSADDARFEKEYLVAVGKRA